LPEKIFFFENSRSGKLLAFLHLPDHQRRDVGIVYCHPFGEEKNCSHFITAAAARSFAEAGFPVLRFDFSGCGDSEDELDEVRFDDWLGDLHCAVKQVQELCDVRKVVLWGLRLGASLATRYAFENTGAIHALLFWQPVLDTAQFARQLIRQRFSSGIAAGAGRVAHDFGHDDVIEIHGYPISHSFYESLASFEIIPTAAEHAMPALVVSISLMEKPSVSMLKSVQALQQHGLQVAQLHIQSEPFWDRYWQWQSKEVMEKSGNWLSGIE
jgi:exosortase A-associated hydrolase 2